MERIRKKKTWCAAAHSTAGHKVWFFFFPITISCFLPLVSPPWLPASRACRPAQRPFDESRLVVRPPSFRPIKRTTLSLLDTAAHAASSKGKSEEDSLVFWSQNMYTRVYIRDKSKEKLLTRVYNI